MGEYLSEQYYEPLKQKVVECRATGWAIKNILAEIYYIGMMIALSEEQEEELYRLADPFGMYNYPADYWWDGCECPPIWECVDLQIETEYNKKR